MISKKILLIVSGLGAIILISLDYVGTSQLCGGRQYTVCMGNLYNVMINFLPIIPLFLLSLITYKMREEIFRAWLKFSYVWIPLTMLAILVSPEYGNALLPIEKGTVGVFFSLLYIIISLLIIAYKYFTLKSKRIV
jgi:hypothetical protein